LAPYFVSVDQEERASHALGLQKRIAERAALDNISILVEIPKYGAIARKLALGFIEALDL
jgi:hypothetical protein